MNIFVTSCADFLFVFLLLSAVVPKTKRPLVKAVEKFVNLEINKAEGKNNPVLFTRYAAIPDEVEKCNAEKGLGFGPDKLAKCGKLI